MTLEDFVKGKKPTPKKSGKPPQPKPKTDRMFDIAPRLELAPDYIAKLEHDKKKVTLTIEMPLNNPMDETELAALQNEAGHWGRYYLLAAGRALGDTVQQSQKKGEKWLKDDLMK